CARLDGYHFAMEYW
nr:immunoglobulin heavy chain junction region [Mus musculus]